MWNWIDLCNMCWDDENEIVLDLYIRWKKTLIWETNDAMSFRPKFLAVNINYLEILGLEWNFKRISVKLVQKQPFSSVLSKRRSENIRKNCMKAFMPKLKWNSFSPVVFCWCTWSSEWRPLSFIYCRKQFIFHHIISFW